MGSLICATLTKATKHGRDTSTHMLVPRMFRIYDSYIVPSATTGIATCKRSSDYQVPNHDRYATRIEEMTNTNSSIKVETCDVFKLIIFTINILVESIPPINLYWWNKFHRSPVPEYWLRGIFSTGGTFSHPGCTESVQLRIYSIQYYIDSDYQIGTVSPADPTVVPQRHWTY